MARFSKVASSSAGFGHEHLARLELTRFAGLGIGGSIGGKALREHQRDALAHHPDGTDRIYQGFDIGFEQIARRLGDHWTLLNKRHRLKSTTLDGTQC